MLLSVVARVISGARHHVRVTDIGTAIMMIFVYEEDQRDHGKEVGAAASASGHDAARLPPRPTVG